MKKKNGGMMKAYMGYSRELGVHEGAVLIFAHSVKEAKRVGWGVMSGMIADEYTDMAVRLIKDDYMFRQTYQWSKNKLEHDEPHVVDSPPSCKGCELWGFDLNDDGYCSDCEVE